MPRVPGLWVGGREGPGVRWWVLPRERGADGGLGRRARNQEIENCIVLARKRAGALSPTALGVAGVIVNS